MWDNSYDKLDCCVLSNFKTTEVWWLLSTMQNSHALYFILNFLLLDSFSNGIYNSECLYETNFQSTHSKLFHNPFFFPLHFLRWFHRIFIEYFYPYTWINSYLLGEHSLMKNRNPLKRSPLRAKVSWTLSFLTINIELYLSPAMKSIKYSTSSFFIS